MFISTKILPNSNIKFYFVCNLNIASFRRHKELKKNNKYENFSLKELRQLPSFNGLCELYFNNLPFYMINILNDDAVPLKYLWRNYYEELSAKLWFEMTRLDQLFRLEPDVTHGVSRLNR